jgi:hypothetical protein
MPLFPPNARTVDATPVSISGFGPGVDVDDVIRTSVFVFANDHGTGQAYWEFRVLLRKLAGALAQAIVTQIVHQSVGGAGTWAATCSMNAEGVLQVVVTGAAATVIDWLATSDEPFGEHGVFA